MSHSSNKPVHPARSPLTIAFYYAVFATLWIYLTSYLFQLNIQDPEILREFELFKGILFVVFTSGLLYLLLSKRLLPGLVNQQDESTPPDETPIPFTGRILLLFVAILLLTPLIVVLITFIEKPRLEEIAFHEREIVAELKATQIENWFKERSSDVQTLSQDPGFIARAQKMIQEGEDTRNRLANRLSVFRKAYGYESVTILSPDMEPVLQTGKSHTIGNLHLDESRSTHTDNPVRQLIYRDANEDLHLDFLAPLYPDTENSKHIGFLLIHASLERFLFPYIQQLSLGYKTDETLLVREKDGKVQFINTPRFSRSEPLLMTMPLDEASLPAAIALRSNKHKPGRYHGYDYRGKPVFAASHPISNFNWQLIAKIDQKEVMQPLHNLLFWVSLVSLFALLIIGISLTMVWRQQQRVNQLQVQTERQNTDSLLTMFYELPFIGIAFTSPQTKRWLRFNHSLCEILGYPKEELAEKTWADLTHPDDIDNDVAQFERVMRNEIDGYHMDKRFIRKDGSVIYAYIDVKCIRKPDGEVDYFIAMVQDINERKRSELALEKARQQAQHYLDIAGVMMIALDNNGCIKMANQRACEILGYKEQELLGKNWFDHFIPEPERQDITSVFNQLINGEIEPVKFFENHILIRNGEHRLIAWHNSALYEDDKITGILSSGEDITASRATQEALKQNQARLKTLIQTIPDMVWLKDPDGIYLTCNPMFERFVGASESQIIGNTDFDFFDPETAEFFRKNDNVAMSAGKASMNEESLTFASDGYQGIFETLKSPMFDQNGQLIGVLGIARDITERQRAATKLAKLSRLYATLSQTNQAIVRSETEDALFQQVCHNAVVYGHFELAWIGLVDHETLAIEPVASYGEQAAAYLKQLALSADANVPSGNGPAGTAARSGKPCWSQDFLNEYPDAPWHEQAEKAGLAAAAALPLYRDGDITGVFVLYAGTPNAFDEASRELLTEMATDINFALDNFERDRKQHETEQRLELVIKGSSDAPWDWDLQSNKIYYSPQWWEMLNYQPDELPSDINLWRRLGHPDDIDKVEQVLQRIQQPGHLRDAVECRFRHKEGHYVPTLIRGIISRDESGKPIRITGTVTDMTERKKIETQLREQLDELNRWFVSTLDREERILELKREINILLQQHQQPPRYPSANASDLPPNEEHNK